MRKALIILLLLTSVLSAKTFFFVVDMSASMKRGFLFNGVKDSLISYINQYTDKGDRIILVGFGSDVRIYEDMKIKSDVDKIRLVTKLHRIDAQDRFTWMTKAFALVGMKLRQLNLRHPEMLKEIYILTDGINEPPPDKKDSLTFDEIIRKYVGDYTKKNVFTYYISFGIQPPTEIRRFLKSLAIKPVIRTRGAVTIFHPQAKIELTDSVAQTLKPAIEIKILCKVTELLKAEGKNLAFKITDIPKGISINFKTDSIIKIRDVGQIDTLTLIISDLTEPGQFSFKLKIVPEDTTVIIEPSMVVIKADISAPQFIKPTPLAWIIAVLAVIIIILISLIQLLSTPKFPDASLVRIDDAGNEIERYELKKYQKLGNNKLRISGDINITGIKDKVFSLIAEKGDVVILKILVRDITAKVITARIELSEGEAYSLKSGDEFEISKVRLKYEA